MAVFEPRISFGTAGTASLCLGSLSQQTLDQVKINTFCYNNYKCRQRCLYSVITDVLLLKVKVFAFVGGLFHRFYGGFKALLQWSPSQGKRLTCPGR